MRRAWLVSLLLPLVPVMFFACGDPPPVLVCDPGVTSFCKCPQVFDLAGSHTCNADGTGFDDCHLDGGEPCPDRPEAQCGNNAVEEGEECDDGNFDDDDACTSLCFKAICGDGLVQDGVEDCDDGNTEDADACTNLCKAGTGCGNGKTESPETCDDGNTDDTDACVACADAFCGDGHLQAGVEDCDDGNMMDGDACLSDCTLPVVAQYGCPGQPLTVAIGTDSTITGDATVATDKYAGACGGGDAPEVVYAVTPAVDGNLSITMDGGGDLVTDPVLYVRSGDCETGAEIGCSDHTFGGGVESLLFAAKGGTTYYVFADGYDFTSGPYTLTLHLQNGVPGDACPGTPVTITPTSDLYFSGDTSLANGGGGTSYKGSGVCASSASTQDVVYSVTPTADGTLVAIVFPAAGYDAQLYARTGSCTTGTQVGCDDAGGPGASEQLSIPVTAGTKISIFVDGKNGSAGAYDLALDLE